MDTDFASGIAVAGPPDGTSLKVLEKVVRADTSWTKFLYNGYAQVERVENYAADNHLLSYTRTDLDDPAAAQADCPRFTLTASKVENFNLDSGGAPQESVVRNTAPASATYSLPNGISGSASVVDVWLEGHPDDLRTKTYYGALGWQEGLPIATEDCLATGSTCTDRKRWTWTEWSQDAISTSYTTNPRAVETRVGDGTNTKRTTIDYHMNAGIPATAKFGLASEVKIYGTDLSTVIKKSTTSYNFDSAYTSRRIVGLPADTQAWGWNDLTSSLELVSKVTYAFDEGDFSDSTLQQTVSPVQHDSANFGSAFAHRGNPTSTTRWDVTQPTNPSAAITTASMKYNTAGSAVARITPWDGTNTRTVRIGYADNWNSTPGVSTYAYPTVVTDPAGSSLGASGHSSTAKYRYDIGANVEATSPAPAGNTHGKTTKRVFDSVGRLQRDSVYVGTAEHSYVRYEYPTNGLQSKAYSTLVDINSDGPDSNDEVLSERWFDGAGRLRMIRVPHTFASGTPATWAGLLTEYDSLGRVRRTSVPTEVDGSFGPAGDDLTRGFLWSYAEYDWMGRTTRTIPTDSNGSDGKDTLITYEGCGCAGGLVTTVQGPLVPRTDTTGDARRKQKSYADILGRTWKTQTFKWDGTTAYLTTQSYFNGRDQVVSMTQTDENSVVQTTTATFDGHGRLSTQKEPNDESGTNTSWTYNGDDSVATVTDPRGAVTTYSYGNPTVSEKRPLLLGISYAPPSTQPSYTTIADTPDESFSYDNLGNRTAMTDGSGTTAYAYDPLSRVTSETKTFTGVTGNFPLTYTYQLSGKLKSITDPFGDTVYYNDDKAARTTSVTGSTYAGVTTYANGIGFRAFGGLKEMTYGSGDGSAISYEYDAGLRPAEYDATSSVLSGGYVRRAAYEYFKDGAVKKVSNLLDSGLDQNYKFDQVGRLVSSISGQKLNNEEEMEEPFTQSISYNAFDDMTSRTNEIWGAVASFTASYTNGRKTSGNEIHDKSGNVVDKTTSSNRYDRWRYDAAGRLHETVMRWWQAIPAPSLDTTQTVATTFDGDGHQVKRVDTNDWFHTFPDNNSGTTTTTEYYIRSTALGGQVVTKLDGAAAKKVTLVYAGAGVLAEQRVTASTPGVYWRHEDIVTGSYSKIAASGSYGGHADDSPVAVEYEPLGGKVEPNDPALPEGVAPPFASLFQFKFAADPARPETGCFVDGMIQDSDTFCSRMVATGIATPDSRFRIPTEWGHWVDEDDPNARPEPGTPPDAIHIATRTRFVKSIGSGWIDPDLITILGFLVTSLDCAKKMASVYASRYKTYSKDPTIGEKAGVALASIYLAGWFNDLSAAQTAYVMATAETETAGFNKLEETGTYEYFEFKYGHKAKIGQAMGHTVEGQGHKYRGHGLIQITGLNNHKWASSITEVDLVANPALLNSNYMAMAQIAVIGVRDGQFGDRISDYINDRKQDYMGARASVNSGEARDNERRITIANRAPEYLNSIRSCYK